MDNLWIYLFIIGIVISFSQKGKKKMVEQESEAPQADSAQEWERRLRELLGETNEEQSEPTSQSATTEQTSTIKPVITPSNSTKHSKYIHIAAKSNTTANKAKNTAAANKPAVASLDDAPNENIEKIIDEFTMEKAVIYAEILKPKYEEY